MSEETSVTQGFNDAELEDIMQEIESLENDNERMETKQNKKQQEVSHSDSDGQIKAVPSSTESLPSSTEEPSALQKMKVAELTDIRPAVQHDALKLQNIIDDEISSIKQKERQNSPDFTPKQTPATTSIQHHSLSFQLQGPMSMSLQIGNTGGSISLRVDQHQQFIVEFPNGAKFQFPLS